MPNPDVAFALRTTGTCPGGTVLPRNMARRPSGTHAAGEKQPASWWAAVPAPELGARSWTAVPAPERGARSWRAPTAPVQFEIARVAAKKTDSLWPIFPSRMLTVFLALQKPEAENQRSQNTADHVRCAGRVLSLEGNKGPRGLVPHREQGHVVITAALPSQWELNRILLLACSI